MKPVDHYFLNQKEPYQSIMLYVRSVILKALPEVTEHFRYNIPFYHIGKKPLLYLNILKGRDYVDVAFVHGVLLEDEFPILRNDNKRKQVRSIPLKSLEDLDQENFEALLRLAAQHLKTHKKAWFL
ncbi:DUF1801 domain-containing protein [Aestuariivivens sediminicola]|uniref:DUF1801 domain-containing protein n=1 Tax=Aestuariivivens sediminicola TaxID=2913560 RepID=UPI001F563467|nr:DUF1801 domain-containing protein [Aestuariivivens sediminicola]